MNHPHTLTRATHDALLFHLSRERDWLQLARESLLLLRHSAMTGDLVALDAAVQQQTALAAARAELSANRDLIFQQAAEQLGVPERPVTLLALAARMSPTARKPVVAVRRELASSARSVRLLAGGASAIIAYKRLIVCGLLGDMLRMAPSEARYTVNGQREQALGRPLVEYRT